MLSSDVLANEGAYDHHAFLRAAGSPQLERHRGGEKTMSCALLFDRGLNHGCAAAFDLIWGTDGKRRKKK